MNGKTWGIFRLQHTPTQMHEVPNPWLSTFCSLDLFAAAFCTDMRSHKTDLVESFFDLLE